MTNSIKNQEGVSGILTEFMNQIALVVNRLLKSEEIDVALYDQDEKDRQNTVLYGINDEATGMVETETKSPIIINKQCLQCSGNASYVRKAFKIACLQYTASKVKYNGEQQTRTDLLNQRYKVVKRGPRLDTEKLQKQLWNVLNSEHVTMDQLSNSAKNTQLNVTLPKVAGNNQTHTFGL